MSCDVSWATMYVRMTLSASLVLKKFKIKINFQLPAVEVTFVGCHAPSSLLMMSVLSATSCGTNVYTGTFIQTLPFYFDRYCLDFLLLKLHFL